MQRKLDNFVGFKIASRGSASAPRAEGTAFNPFDTEPSICGNEETITKKKPVKEIVNILDAPPSRSAPIENFLRGEASPGSTKEKPDSSPMLEAVVASSPLASSGPLPVAHLFPKDDPPPRHVEMIQPKSKEGKRLLYKHPNLPKVGVKGAYWLLVGESDRSEAAWLIQFDGAANPNPGPASSGAVLWSPKDLDGKRTPVFESGKFLGKATNNIAEVQGLLLGLQIAATRGAREVLIEGDSELIIFQQTGKYKVSDKNLKVWWANIQAAMMDETSFDWVAIRQVPREQNERADSITKEVLSRKQSFQRA
jgi:ribonuclease HI